jgi:MFS family permease
VGFTLDLGLSEVQGLILNVSGLFGALFIIDAEQVVLWILMANTYESFFPLVYICRIIHGMNTGICSGMVAMSIVEISPKELSGSFGSLSQLFNCVGNFYAFFLGVFFKWRNQMYFSIIITALQMFVIWFVPDSHVIEHTEDGVKLESLFQRKFLTYVLHSAALVFGQQLSGINAVISNLTQIFEGANINLRSEIAAMLAAGAQVISTLMTSKLIHIFGRRVMNTVSHGGMCISLILLMISYMLTTPVPELPVIALFTHNFFFFFGIGAGPIPWLIVPELFPDSVRSFVSLLFSSSNWVFAGIIVLIWPFIKEKTGDAYGFLIWVILCLLNTLYNIFLMPESIGPEPVENHEEEEQEEQQQNQEPLGEESHFP